MTQPVAPGTRAACFDEPPGPIECTSPAPPVHPPPLCTEGARAFEVVPARSPPSVEPRIFPEPAGLRFCREADTVVEGFLCSEPGVASNACRKPGNAIDAYICDEPRMHALETSVWQATLGVLKTLVSVVVGRSKVGR